jgi:hypothetical protein
MKKATAEMIAYSWLRAGHFDGILAIDQEPFGIAQKVPGPPKG